MKARARIVRITSETGPRSMNVLRGVARMSGEAEQLPKIVRDMRAAGELVKYGKKRDSKWGAPGWKRPPHKRFS